MRSENRQAGFVLYAVLGVTALLASTYVAISLSARAAAGTAAIAGLDLDREALTQAGLDMAGYRLFVLGSPAADLDGLAVRFDAGEVRLSVLAETGKADLNGSAGPALAAAYSASGGTGMTPEAFAQSVVDWRRGGPDGQARVFARLDELRDLGLSPSEIDSLSRFATVFNPVGQLSIGAVDPLLTAALPGVDAASVEAIAAGRGRLDEAAQTAILARLAELAPLFTTTPPEIFRVRLAISTLGSEMPLEREAVMIRSPNETRPYGIVAWK